MQALQGPPARFAKIPTRDAVFNCQKRIASGKWNQSGSLYRHCWAIAGHGVVSARRGWHAKKVGTGGRHPFRSGCVNLACEDWLVIRLANRFESHFWID